MKIIRQPIKMTKRVSFSKTSYAHDDERTEFVPTKEDDGLTLLESIFEEFMLTMMNKSVPYQQAILDEKFSVFKDEIIKRIRRLINNFETMVKKNPRGIKVVKRYSPYCEMGYNFHKKIQVPIVSCGGGKALSMSIDHKQWIDYMKKIIE